MGRKKNQKKKSEGPPPTPDPIQVGDPQTPPPGDVPESEKLDEAAGGLPPTVQHREASEGGASVGQSFDTERGDGEEENSDQLEFSVHDLDEETVKGFDVVTNGVYMCIAYLQAVANEHKDPNARPVVTGLSGRQQREIRTMGIKEGKLKEIAKDLSTCINKLDADEQMKLLKDLWDKGPTRDSQLLAIHLFTQLVTPLTWNVGFERVFELMEHFLTVKSGWDTVKMLAKRHVNALTFLDPPVMGKKADKWINNDEQPWLQVAALLHQSCLGKFTNMSTLFRHCEKMFGMKEDAAGYQDICDAISKALLKYATTAALPSPSNEKQAQDTLRATMDVSTFLKKNFEKMTGGMADDLSILSELLDDKVPELLEEEKSSKREETEELRKEMKRKLKTGGYRNKKK